MVIKKCSWCGDPAPEGHAWIDDKRFCHRDDMDITCFMQAQHDMTRMYCTTCDDYGHNSMTHLLEGA